MVTNNFFQNIDNIRKVLKDDGVVLTKNFFEKKEIDNLSVEYNYLDKELTNKEIFKNKPVIVFWKHLVGEQKRIAAFDQMPNLWNLIKDKIVPFVKKITQRKKLQLLETIIFNKPGTNNSEKGGNTLHWHQDVAYFPLKPNNQVAVWFPLEPVSIDGGCLHYALKSHKLGIRGSTDLHTRKKFDGENRELIPEDPQKAGFKVVPMEMSNQDILIHDGYTWHYSGPNKLKDYVRKGISVRFIVDECVFDPRPGQGAAFTKQITINPGEKFEGLPFPTM